jgi:TolB-like protein
MRSISICCTLIAGLFIAIAAQTVRGEDMPKPAGATKPANLEPGSANPVGGEQNKEPTPEEIEQAKQAALEKAEAEELARAEAEERRIRLEELERVKAEELRLGEMDLEDRPQSEVLRIRPIAPLKAPPQELLAFKISGLADALAKNLNDAGADLFVATFADSDRMNGPNSFGRYVAEELMEKMHKLGFGVVELRLPDKPTAEPGAGARVLATRPGETTAYNGNTILSGTYKKAGDVLEVHAEIVSRPAKKVVSAASFEIVMDKDDAFMQEMLDNQTGRANPAAGKVEKGR